jgi:hypothetical protein
MFPSIFSLAVAGNGKLMQPLVERLKERFPGIVIYDRNEEARRSQSDQEHPLIPQVAYVDVRFHRKGVKEVATIRCFHRHRFFNYDLEETQPGSKREDYLMNSMLDAVETLCKLPRIRTPEVLEEPPVTEESGPGETASSEATDEREPEAP